MERAISVQTTRYSEFFKRLFDRYSSSAIIEIEGVSYRHGDTTILKENWCTNAKIRQTREFRLCDGDRFVASFHDSVSELFISVDEADWIQSLSDEKLLRYEILPIK